PSYGHWSRSSPSGSRSSAAIASFVASSTITGAGVLANFIGAAAAALASAFFASFASLAALDGAVSWAASRAATNDTPSAGSSMADLLGCGHETERAPQPQAAHCHNGSQGPVADTGRPRCDGHEQEPQAVLVRQRRRRDGVPVAVDEPPAASGADRRVAR